MATGSGTGTPLDISTVIDSLIPYIRVRLGDISSPYRYEDSWISSAVRAAVVLLERYNYNKYIISTSTNDIIRNPYFTSWYYSESEVGVLEPQDVSIFVTASTLIISQGDLESNAWNVGSWKDFEISYSNISAGKHKNDNISRLWDELHNLITPPTKRLATPRKGSLPGYLGNKYETDTHI